MFSIAYGVAQGVGLVTLVENHIPMPPPEASGSPQVGWRLTSFWSQGILGVNYIVSQNHVTLSSKWMVTFSSLYIFIQNLEPSNTPLTN
jgi:hypothetical protein